MKGILLAVAGCLAATLTGPAFADSLTRSCDYKGDGKLGPLTIDFDEAARSVRVTTPDGRVYRYQNGVTGRIGPATADDDLGPVEQFVNLRPDRVEVGFRWLDDGSTGHLAYFDPTAFKNPAKRCVWRSLWAFATG
ncbi:hypothetical protein DFR50_121100 [Roseiarcus fermentans]|uniref:Uncharacterized protein n=1 Tax=Roseiarcus fermentans TaxID=1473586 RepID=A0A366F556_9HYPH|nr:hypothetical protein [Roseiarcus fermentans]RBP09754.1 hypothetical protein DFR50_121100 [Roseiarcus fermentans]